MQGEAIKSRWINFVHELPEKVHEQCTAVNPSTCI